MVARMYEHGKALNTASHFEIDDVIDPADTRRWIVDRPRIVTTGSATSRQEAPEHRHLVGARRCTLTKSSCESSAFRTESVFKTSFAAESEKVAVIVTVRADGVEGYGEGVMDTVAGLPRRVDPRRPAPAA